MLFADFPNSKFWFPGFVSSYAWHVTIVRRHLSGLKKENLKLSHSEPSQRQALRNNQSIKALCQAVNKSEASPSDLKFKENPTDINCALVYTCRLSKRGYLLNI